MRAEIFYMSLRNAILGVLSGMPMTGYDLAEVFDRGTGFFWSAGQAQIYPELRKMERQGLLTAKVMQRGLRARRVYAVTEAGLSELQSWLKEAPVYGPDRDRDSEKLRAMYLDMTTFDDARRFFETHAEHYERRLALYRLRLARLLQKGAPLIKSRLANRPEEEHDAIIAYKEFTLEGQIAHAELEIAWARKGHALATELENRRARRRKSRTRSVSA